MTSQEPVGSIGEEAVKLLKAWTQESADGEQHGCTHAWCPLCQVADHVLANPEILDQITRAAATFAATVRDLLDTSEQSADDA